MLDFASAALVQCVRTSTKMQVLLHAPLERVRCFDALELPGRPVAAAETQTAATSSSVGVMAFIARHVESLQRLLG